MPGSPTTSRGNLPPPLVTIAPGLSLQVFPFVHISALILSSSLCPSLLSDTFLSLLYLTSHDPLQSYVVTKGTFYCLSNGWVGVYCAYVHHIFLIGLSIVGHLGCSHSLLIVTCVYLYLLKLVFFFLEGGVRAIFE